MSLWQRMFGNRNRVASNVAQERPAPPTRETVAASVPLKPIPERTAAAAPPTEVKPKEIWSVWLKNRSQAEQFVADDPTGLYPHLRALLAMAPGMSTDKQIAILEAVKEKRYAVVPKNNGSDTGFDLAFYTAPITAQQTGGQARPSLEISGKRASWGAHSRDFAYLGAGLGWVLDGRLIEIAARPTKADLDALMAKNRGEASAFIMKKVREQGLNEDFIRTNAAQLEREAVVSFTEKLSLSYAVLYNKSHDEAGEILAKATGLVK